MSAGPSIQLHASDALACRTGAQRVHEQVYDVLARRLPLSITIEGLGASPHAERTFGQICTVLQTAVSDAGANAASVSIVVDAALISPQPAWARRSEILGPGPVYLLVGRSLMQPSIDKEARLRQERFWAQCWGLRNIKSIRVAFAPLITSQCPLLSPEAASGILPSLGLQAPPGSAWVAMQVNVARFANSCGELNEPALRRELQSCVELGDSLHDKRAWPTAAMRHDAWLNRRLAITVTGIGDLAKLRSLDPRSFATLQELSAVLRQVRGVLGDHSRNLAIRTNYLPALDLADPSRGPGCELVQLSWKKRWRQALHFAGTRHRNLLVMSPWSVFPGGEAADYRYCDLLPLLQYADACTFPALPCINHWNIKEFKEFHRRAWAVLESKEAQQLIAEQV